MDTKELYSIICSLSKVNSADYGIMIPFHEIYTFLETRCGENFPPSLLESDLEHLEKSSPDKIRLIRDGDLIQGVKLLTE